MKYNLLIIFLYLSSCGVNSTKIENRTPYNAKGLAYIYNEQDNKDKLIKGKLDNNLLQVSHYNLPTNTLFKLINPKNNEYITLKNYKKIKYPNFYKIMITKKVAEKLSIDPELPYIEIIEIKKNKSFIAKKAKIFNEEKKISSKAPVTSVEISNISENKIPEKFKENKISILIATFYSSETALFLKQRIIKEIPKFDNKKLKIRKKSSKEIELISGPYKTINFMKNDYIQLTNFGFEEMDITINE